MVNFADLESQKEKICVVGLGYVGLPLAIEFARHFSVIGFDIKKERISELQDGFDRTKEVNKEKLLASKLEYSSNPSNIEKAKFIVIAVPTPVDKENLPDLFLVEKATEMVGKNLAADSAIVYESTVYPGVTDDICVPILEKESGLKCGADFKVGYSPERINPGDKEHTIDKVVKVVSGMDEESAELVAQVYGKITKVYKAKSIKVAEAAKVIENTQRDINIALMNELALIFEKMNISVYDVLDAAGTKWNFLQFVPGLVGGHCIGVDPYYLTYIAQKIGYHPEVILSGRKTNDNMPGYIVEKIFNELRAGGNEIKDKTFVLFGITFKENIPDSRNSKSALIYQGLRERGVELFVTDPLAYEDEVEEEYKIKLTSLDKLPKADILIISVAHADFQSILSKDLAKYANPDAFIFDVKRILDRESVEAQGYKYLTL